MPQGKGTYGSKVGRPPKKKAATKAKKPVKRITQEEIEARLKADAKRAKSSTPSPAMQKKMAEQMRNKKMDAKMKAAAKKAGVPMRKKNAKSKK
jgi:hypothetical protein